MQQKIQQNRNPAKTTSKGLLKRARSRVMKQAVLTLFTVLVTVILLFSMTTAWYTNVAEVSGLTFEAEAWGFEGDVVIQEEAISAAPGDSGIVYLSVTNSSDTASAITVNISKSYMDPVQLQQRVYFYIDEQVTRNDEIVSKQYLSNTSGYTYTLYGHNTLILSEKVYTDARLKWEWVYDVVGYYVRGTVANNTVQVEEYLRPVEYSFDDATYDEEGKLLTVDGTTSVNAFLAECTASDGYAGAFVCTDEDELTDKSGNSVTPVDGYYPVYQDDEQQIWLYLCSKSEIEENTRWDTAFGTASADSTSRMFQVRVSVSGQQLNQNVIQVSSPDGLSDALNGADGGIVQLASSMVIPEAVEIGKDCSAVLDLNGNEITYTGDNYAFSIAQGGDLTVVNGTIQGNPDGKNSAFCATGGQLTLSNVNVNDMYMAVDIRDSQSNSNQGANSFVKIVDCELTTSDITVKINGDGALSGEKTYLIIQNSKIYSEEYVGIMGNGSGTNPGNWGTDIQIIGSEVYGYYAGIYHPQQQSVLTISDSKVSGITGIAIKGGSVYVIDSTIMGLGTTGDIATPSESMLNGSGFVDSGDGIYVETDYEYAVTVNISGSETNVSSTAPEKTYAVRVFPEANYVNIVISGGTFSSDVSDYAASGYECEASGNAFVVVEAE